ncbi:MAG: N-acetyltransferase family protein [Hyphomicrobium sp.]
MTADFPLRPFLPADTLALRDLYGQSIEELTADDYEDDQRLAWMAQAEDANAFARRLGAMLTLVVQVNGEYLGFASLKDNTIIDMLYVHPHHSREGVGRVLVGALEKIATARGAQAVTTDASDTAQPFFERLGYQSVQRNSVPIEDQWLYNTTMTKSLTGAASPSATRAS